jgi:GNAT superfamily N-acetyltransferase
MIRPATTADIGALLLLAEAMHAESRYAPLPFDLAKVADLFGGLIGGAGCLLVAERDGEIVGGLAGWCAEHFFTRAKIASDFGLFVPQNRRGGLVAARLLQAFAAWAQGQGAAMVQAGITTGVNVAATTRLYQGVGFVPVGTIFEYQGA